MQTPTTFLAEIYLRKFTPLQHHRKRAGYLHDSGIPETIPTGESFVLFDSIGDNHRYIGLGTPISIAAFTSCRIIFMDGTFEKCHSTFPNLQHPPFIMGRYFNVLHVVIIKSRARNLGLVFVCGLKNQNLPTFSNCQCHRPLPAVIALNSITMKFALMN